MGVAAVRVSGSPIKREDAPAGLSAAVAGTALQTGLGPWSFLRQDCLIHSPPQCEMPTAIHPADMRLCLLFSEGWGSLSIMATYVPFVVASMMAKSIKLTTLQIDEHTLFSII